MKTDLLVLLREQHAEIDELLEKLATSTSPRSNLLLELAAKLAAHVAVESRVFYPAIMLQTSELRSRSLAESQAIKRQVADMLALDPDSPDGHDDDAFDVQLDHLATAIRHHAHDFEESQLFPLLAELMDDDERDELGVRASEMYRALIESADDGHRVAA